jgi:rhodanese-related sulfurtransferase
VGRGGVDKRIDTIGVAMRLGGGVADLEDLELAYAPPYSSAKDPVNMAGFTAGNLLRGLVRFAPWDVKSDDNTVFLDVREDAELMALTVPGAIAHPPGPAARPHDELDRSKTIVVLCAIGVRAYNAARILMQNGFENVLSIPAEPNSISQYIIRSYAMENTNSRPRSGGGSRGPVPGR